MRIFHLPDDIFPDEIGQPGNIIIHPYQANVGSFKGKSIMTMNAVSLVMNGEKTMHFAAKTVNADDAHIHVLTAGNCIAAMKFAERKTFSSLLLFFDATTMSNFMVKYQQLIEQTNIKEAILPEPYVSIKKDAFIVNFIESMLINIKAGFTFPAAMKQLKFEELMLHLLLHHSALFLSFLKSTTISEDEVLIKKAVEANITSNISLDELAFLCNISLSTFKRRFVKMYQCPPAKWFQQQRMQMARDLLTLHNNKPAEVYHRVGYEDHSTFSHIFKQTYGITPTEFRNEQMNDFR